MLGMNSFMYVLPWATPAPIGLILGTGAGILSIVLMLLLIVVDSLIYLPFIKAYDDSLVEEEAKKAEAESVLKKLLAEGMSADEILEKLK